MFSEPHRSRTASISSIGSLAKTAGALSMETPSASPEPRGVGLSDPTQSAYRRKILEVVDRMRATGYLKSFILSLRHVLISA